MSSTLRRVALAALTAMCLLGLAGSATAAPSAGFNDWRCRPSAAHPEPLVLLHGLGGNGPGNYAYLGPHLAGAGYCAFSPTYGQPLPPIPVGGIVRIADSSREIAAFVDRVRERTGAARVSIVGHSEGGFQSLYVPKVLGYAGKVRRVVALAPPTHGTTFAGLVSVGDLLGLRGLVDLVLNTVGCGACSDLIVRGGAVKRLTDGPIAQPGVQYTIIATRHDLLVTPHENSFIREDGVRNAFVQDTCPADPVGHVGLAFDSGVAHMIANALDPERATKVKCGIGLPL